MAHIRFSIQVDTEDEEPSRVVRRIEGTVSEYEGESDTEKQIGHLRCFLVQPGLAEEKQIHLFDAMDSISDETAECYEAVFDLRRTTGTPILRIFMGVGRLAWIFFSSSRFVWMRGIAERELGGTSFEKSLKRSGSSAASSYASLSHWNTPDGPRSIRPRNKRSRISIEKKRRRLKVCGSSGKSAVSFSFRVQTSSLTVRDCCGSRTRTRGNRVRCGCHEGGEDLFAEEIAEFDHWSLVWCPS